MSSSKKKAGRPRKLKPLDGCVPVDGAPIVKRGRGRPRKYPLPEPKPLMLLSPSLVWGAKRKRKPSRRRTDYSFFVSAIPFLENSALRPPEESGFQSSENLDFSTPELLKIQGSVVPSLENSALRPPEESGFQSSENLDFSTPELLKIPGLPAPWEESGFDQSLGNSDLPPVKSPAFKPVTSLDSDSDVSEITCAADPTPSPADCTRDLPGCQWNIPGPIPDLVALMRDPAIINGKFFMNVPDIGDWFDPDP